jgi:hypothetical protein
MKSRVLLRITTYLLIYLGVPAFLVLLNHETISAVLAIVYIFLLIPFGILRVIDFYRTNDGTTVLSRAFNLLFRVPLALFGFVCLGAGVTMIGWVLYNVFIERRKEYTGPSFVIGWASFGVGLPLVLYGWFTLRSAVRRKEAARISPEEQKDFEHEDDDEEGAA